MTYWDRQRQMKGDLPGHPFRGNQYMSAAEVGGGGGVASPPIQVMPVMSRLEQDARKQSKYGGGYAEEMINGWRLGVGIQERYSDLTGRVTQAPVWSVNGQKMSKAKALEKVRKPKT